MRFRALIITFSLILALVGVSGVLAQDEPTEAESLLDLERLTAAAVEDSEVRRIESATPWSEMPVPAGASS